MSRCSAILILAALLGGAGCGPGRSPEAVPAPAEVHAPVAAPSKTVAPIATADKRPLVVCFGDSLTAGYGTDLGQSYPDYLQRDLDRSGYAYRVVNEGISGNTTKDGQDRIDGVVRQRPEVVVLEFGGNDGLRGLKIDTTRANLADMIETLEKAHIRVLLAGITLPPDYGPDYVSRFTAIYPQLAKQYRVPVLPFLLKGVYGVDGMMQGDRTHATSKGNAVVAKNVYALLTPMLMRH